VCSTVDSTLSRPWHPWGSQRCRTLPSLTELQRRRIYGRTVHTVAGLETGHLRLEGPRSSRRGVDLPALRDWAGRWRISRVCRGGTTTAVITSCIWATGLPIYDGRPSAANVRPATRIVKHSRAIWIDPNSQPMRAALPGRGTGTPSDRLGRHRRVRPMPAVSRRTQRGGHAQALLG
jgi:hypothetical protein